MNDTMKSIVTSTIAAIVVSLITVTVINKQKMQEVQQAEPKQEAVDTLDKAEVEQIVKDYITNNPDAIIESLNQLQQRERQRQQQAASATIKEKSAELKHDEDTPYAGNPNADVVLVEFFDYNCGYCRKVMPTVAKLLEEYDNLKVVFKEFPILSPVSQQAARAAQSVYYLDKDKYFDYHQALMKHTGAKNKQAFLDLAKEMGIDTKKMEEMMDSKRVTDAINKNKILGQSIGVRGTPAFVIGEDLIPGAVDISTLRSKIDAQLKN